jgi:hypothetical protein
MNGIARIQGDISTAKKTNNLKDIAFAEAELKAYRDRLAQLTAKPAAPGAAGAPKPGTPGATGTPKPGTPAAAAAPIAVPANSPAAVALTSTATQTAQLNQKATTQIKETVAVKTAVNALTTKMTAPSSLQTSVSSIYNLLASGMLRVQALLPKPPNPKAKAFGEPGRGFSSLSKAAAFENKHKPPGSSLVVANSSETIIPAAYGFIPSQGMFSSSRSGMSSGAVSVSAPITIYQQPGQSTDELASIVALKIGEAVADARSASVFV